MSVEILPLRHLRKEDCEFQDSLAVYVTSSCLKTLSRCNSVSGGMLAQCAQTPKFESLAENYNWIHSIKFQLNYL